MGKSALGDRSLFFRLVTLGLVALIVVVVAHSIGSDDSAACTSGQAVPSPSVPARPNLTLHQREYSHEEPQLLVRAGSAAHSEPALLLTIPVTGVPTVGIIETLISETRELPLPTGDVPAVPTGALPSLPTAPAVLSTPISEPSALPTPTTTPTPSGTEQKQSRLLVLGTVGLAILCAGGILTGGLLLFALRRRSKRVAPGEVGPAQLPEEHAALVIPGVDPVVLMPGVTTIGRSEENDIIIEDHQVSRHHARIACAEGVCTIEDLQSSNGSFLNGERVSRAVLRTGDRLRIGDVAMTYRAPRAQGPGVWLEVKGERRPLTSEGLTIGRSSENEIQLADPLASRKHARIESAQGTHLLIDLDSANGTFVNEQRVQRHSLQDGDAIRIGSSRIVFRSQNSG